MPRWRRRSTDWRAIRKRKSRISAWLRRVALESSPCRRVSLPTSTTCCCRLPTKTSRIPTILRRIRQRHSDTPPELRSASLTTPAGLLSSVGLHVVGPALWRLPKTLDRVSGKATMSGNSAVQLEGAAVAIYEYSSRGLGPEHPSPQNQP